MKPSVKIYFFSAVLFIFGIFLIILSQTNMAVSEAPFEATVEKAEQSDISGYDYFKLSGGYIVPYASVYEVEEPGNNVTEVVYPFVSGAYLDKARKAYEATHNNQFDQAGYMEWFETYKVKPKFYVQAKIDKMGEDAMFAIVLADSLEKNIEGMRIHSSVSISTKILPEYEKQGITIENSVFITEGENPEQAKNAASVVLVIGGIIALCAIVLFFRGRSAAKKFVQASQYKY